MTITLSRRAVIAGLLAINLVLASALVLLFTLGREMDRAEELRRLGASEFADPAAVTGFDLIDQAGEPFDEARLLGRWSVVFFGFTSCDDICPLTVAELGRTLDALPAGRGSDMQMLFVTVDPERDRPEGLANYLEAFHPGLIGLTGAAEEIQSLAEQLYVVVNNPSRPEYLPHAAHGAEQQEPTRAGQIDHSSHLALIDPQGRLRAVLRPPHRSRDLLAVLAYFR